MFRHYRVIFRELVINTLSNYTSISNVTVGVFFSVALRPNAGQGLLILEVSRIKHNDAPQSVGLLWTSDQLVAETFT